MTTDPYATLDEALIRMRRLWGGSTTAGELRRDAGGGVELSTVLVADAVARGRSAAGSVGVGDVGTLLDVAPSTASRLVDRAVTAGMVRREPAADARRCTLTLTAEGRDLVRRATAYRTSHLRDVLSDWTPSDVDALAALLSRFAHTVRRPSHTVPGGTP